MSNKRQRHHRTNRHATTFAHWPAATRVEAIEHVLSHVVPVIQADRTPGPITPETLARLDQLHHAMCDENLDEEAFDAMSKAFCAYLVALPPDQLEEAKVRDMNFVMALHNMPWHATCPGDWFRHVTEHGLSYPVGDDEDA